MILEQTYLFGREAMEKKKKMSVQKAYWLGQLIVNGGVILTMIGVWVFSFVLVVKAGLSVWIILMGVFAGPLVAWVWWSFSVSRWRYWVRQYLDEDEIEELHQRAVSGQLEWSRGSIFEKTEFKSSKHKSQDLSAVIKSTIKFLNKEAPGFISEFKASFPDFDTSIIDEIRGFIFNLNATLSTTEDTVGFDESAKIVDDLIERLHKATDVLKGRQWGEVREWLYVVSGLTERLNRIKSVLKSVQ
jgi:hypothetical protein